MENTFWIGVWPGLDTNCIGYIIEKFREFFNK
jgi:CDP-6-deoxy-D-xylo-4-hexulose-3-dehydrase